MSRIVGCITEHAPRNIGGSLGTRIIGVLKGRPSAASFVLTQGEFPLPVIEIRSIDTQACANRAGRDRGFGRQ